MTRWHLTVTAVILLEMTFNTSLGRGDDKTAMRTWNSTAGTQIHAALVDVEGQQARLQRTDGTVISVPIDKLSTTDQEFIGQWLDRRPARSDLWKLFKYRSTGEEVRGKVLQRFNIKGRRKLEVQDATGRTSYIWEDEWEITKAPPDVPGVGPGTGAAGSPAPAGNAGPKSTPSPPPTPSPTSSVVLVTGSGADPSQAEKNALAQALERTIGVMVDGETLVRNDEVVRDEILTYTKGYIQDYDVLRTWQQDGIAYVEISARVSVSKLGEKLKAKAASELQVNGRLMQVQAELEEQYERNACEMFRRATADLTPDKLLTVQVAGEPQFNRDTATVTVKFKVSANLDGWKNIHSGVKQLVQHLALGSARGQFTEDNYWQMAGKLPVKGVRGEDVITYLYSGKSPEGNVVFFDVFLIPKWLEPEISALAARHAAYQIRIALLDQAGQVVAESQQPPGNSLVVRLNTLEDTYLSSTIAPLPYSSWEYAETKESTRDFRLPVAQWGRVAKCAAMWTRKPGR